MEFLDLSADVVSLVVGCVFSFRRAEVLRPAVGRYAHLRPSKCRLWLEPPGTIGYHSDEATSAPMWLDTASFVSEALEGTSTTSYRVWETSRAVLQETVELNSLLLVSKSFGKKVRSALVSASRCTEDPAATLLFYARSDFALLLSIVISSLPRDQIEQYNGSAVVRRSARRTPRENDYCRGRNMVEGGVLHVAVASRARNSIGVLIDILSKLALTLDALDSNMETPLFIAVKLGEVGIATRLIAAAADVNSVSCSELIAETHYAKDGGKVPPLVMAAYLHQLPMVELLLQSRAHADDCGNDGDSPMSPIVAACLETCLQPCCTQSWRARSAGQVVRVLLETRANPWPASETWPMFMLEQGRGSLPRLQAGA